MKFITYSVVQRLFWSINLVIIYLNIQELSIAQTPPQSSQTITIKVSGKAVFGIQGRTSATTDLTNPNGAIGRDGIPETNDPTSN
jgi:hypothetical protein